MLNEIFGSVLLDSTTAPVLDMGNLLLCTAVSLFLGGVIAFFYSYKNTSSKSFVVTLVLLPAIVQMVILLVNGNLGTGVAVMGAFSLVRFRSAPGSAKEICSIFLAMAVGLATGMGYLAVAALFALLVGGASCLLSLSKIGRGKPTRRELHITIPESLNYSDVFDDLMEKYTAGWELIQVRTANMGSLFRLTYELSLKNPKEEKSFLDELRCRNGNLEISCGRIATVRDEL